MSVIMMVGLTFMLEIILKKSLGLRALWLLPWILWLNHGQLGELSQVREVDDVNEIFFHGWFKSVSRLWMKNWSWLNQGRRWLWEWFGEWLGAWQAQGMGLCDPFLVNLGVQHDEILRWPWILENEMKLLVNYAKINDGWVWGWFGVRLLAIYSFCDF